MKAATDAMAKASAGEGADVDRKQYTLQDFEMLKVLGKGTFGKVMLAREKATNENWAIKVCPWHVVPVFYGVKSTRDAANHCEINSNPHWWRGHVVCTFPTQCFR